MKIDEVNDIGLTFSIENNEEIVSLAEFITRNAERISKLKIVNLPSIIDQFLLEGQRDDVNATSNRNTGRGIVNERITIEEMDGIAENCRCVRDLEMGKIYLHYKGGVYKVVDVCINTETLQLDIVYKDMDDVHWVRSFHEFHELVTLHDGTEVRRFRELSEVF